MANDQPIVVESDEEVPTASLSRRRFFKIAAAGGGVAALSVLGGKMLIEWLDRVPPDVTRSPERAARWIMLIDLARCDGCGLCTKGCRETHFVPDGQEWIKVYKIQDENGGEFFLPRPCMQCDNAPCVNVCPVGATYKVETGAVLVDHRRCIGCRYCMAACPYNARYFNWGEPAHTPAELAHEYRPEAPWPHRRGVVEKCMFCAHRTAEGELPACAMACPMNAIFFGDAKEDAVTNRVGETWRLSETLRTRGAFRFKEDLGTKPRVFYLPARRA